MKKTLKSVIAILLVLVLAFSTFACGTDFESSESSEEENKYANVDGYPIEKGDLQLHKMFINGDEYFLVAYTHKDDPEHLYFSPTPMIYDLGGNGVGISSGKKAAWAFNFADSFAVMTLGNPNFSIDGEVYLDVAPENYKDEKYGDSWYCGTLFLEKMLDAEVHFSPDRSAAYLITNKSIAKEDTEKFDLKVTVDGKLTATNKEDGSIVKLNVDGSRSDAAKTESKGGNKREGNNKPKESRITCSRCGGSGNIVTMENVYNPATKGYEMRSKSTPCTVCGGRGYTVIYN